MGSKEKTNIYIDSDVKRRAVELGLNLSKVSENSLIIAIQALNGSFGSPNSHLHCEGRGRDLNPGARLHRPEVDLRLPAHTHASVLKEFRVFLTVDLQRKKLTVDGHAQTMARCLKWLGDQPVTREILRDYLQLINDTNPGAYKNTLSGLKVFFRDYEQRPDLVATFKFPSKELELKQIPPKSQLQEFYYALEPLDPRMAGYFLLYATSGWRRREVMALHREDVDLKTRIMDPRVKSSTTKGRLIGLFNEEAQDVLKRYILSRSDTSPKLLPISEKTFRAFWHQAADRCGFLLQPQLLRDWFCEAMGNLKVPDRYIDAFCGRVPKSVLAKHYTDYAPEKLKRIYDQADLKVLA